MFRLLVVLFSVTYASCYRNSNNQTFTISDGCYMHVPEEEDLITSCVSVAGLFEIKNGTCKYGGDNVYCFTAVPENNTAGEEHFTLNGKVYPGPTLPCGDYNRQFITINETHKWMSVMVPLVEDSDKIAYTPEIKLNATGDIDNEGFSNYLLYQHVSYKNGTTVVCFNRNATFNTTSGYGNAVGFWEQLSRYDLSVNYYIIAKEMYHGLLNQTKALKEANYNVSMVYSAHNDSFKHRSKRSVPVIPVAADSNKCKMFFWWNSDARDNALRLSCKQLAADYGDNWFLCTSVKVDHCYKDESGGWEDGGLHTDCATTYVSMFQRVLTCSANALFKFANRWGLSLLNNIKGNTALIRANGKRIETNQAQIAKNSAANINLGRKLIVVEKTFTAHLKDVKRFRANDTTWKQSVDIRLVNIEYRLKRYEYKQTVMEMSHVQFQEKLGLKPYNSTHYVYDPNGTVYQRMIDMEQKWDYKSNELNKNIADISNATLELEKDTAHKVSELKEYKNITIRQNAHFHRKFREQEARNNKTESDGKRNEKTIDRLNNVTSENSDRHGVHDDKYKGLMGQSKMSFGLLGGLGAGFAGLGIIGCIVCCVICKRL